MDSLSSIEFIDLSGIEEKEKLWILNSLRTWDPSVRGPWQNPHQVPIKNTGYVEVPQQYYQNGPNYASSVPNRVISVGENFINVPSNNMPHCYPPIYRYQPYQPPLYNYYHSDADGQHGSPIFVPPLYSQQFPMPQDNMNNIVKVNYNQGNNNLQPVVMTSVVSEQHEMPAVINGIDTLNLKDKDKDVLQIESQTFVPNVPALESSLINGVKEKNDESSESNVKEDDVNGVANETNNTLKPAVKSWASLFSESNGVNSPTVQKVPNEISAINDATVQDIKTIVTKQVPNIENDKLKATYDDPVYYILGEFLSSYELDHRTISLQPKGLINRSNYCYINSILQALVACPPIYNLLNAISHKITTNDMKKQIPIINTISTFIKEFQPLPAGQRVSRRVDKTQKQDPNILINCDIPFEPIYFHKMLNGMRSDTFVVEGRQEDAEEFLCCLLNGMNDEMLELMKLVGKHKTKVIDLDPDMDKEWQVMGPKNKGCVTRRTEILQTPISSILNGHVRSRIYRAGDKSTDNIQPFFTLPLNIEKVSTVREALEALISKNQLEGITSSTTNKEVEAWQQVTIEELPYVLILHLKCFDYKLDGCTKIIKALEFPIDLKIDAKLLSSKTNVCPKEKQYKLFAIVYHDGKEASKGHYITDVYHVGYSSWLRYDDSSVKPIPKDHVLKPHGTRVPYLLFYRRNDSIRSK